MLLLKYLLLITGWGLLAASAANVFRNLYQVVQYHRQLRPIAPLSGAVSTLDGAPAGPSTHGSFAEKPQLNWTTAKWAFLAAWLPLTLAAGIVVVPSGMGGIRVSQTAGTRPGTVASFCRKSNRADCSRRDSRPVRRRVLTTDFH